ncbi:MAG: hypothetical protein KJ002_00195 [Candidatus Dadabacteria bacterium]|nr:hypothetical protein [Candidatus Dadabacteria bacterium]
MKLVPLLLILLLVLASPEPGLAGGKETLVDISGVAVIVDEVSATARADGLLESDIKALVISKLEKSGITLLEDREWYSVFGGAYLLVEVIASKSQSGDYYAVFIDLELHQTVVLFGKKLGQNITTAAPTWSTGKLLSCPAVEIKTCVETSVGELADMFVKDFLEVNSGKNAR